MRIRSIFWVPIFWLLFQTEVLFAEEAGAGTRQVQRSKVAVVLGGGGGHSALYLFVGRPF